MRAGHVGWQPGAPGRPHRSVLPFAFMATLQQMGYEELNRLIASGQGGQLGEMAFQEEQRHLLSGDATWAALQSAVAHLVSLAPQDYDVLLQIFDLAVLEARYIEPHTFLFKGVGQDGNQAGIVCHFTQVVARVIYLPKKGQSRVVTGFAKTND
jgi:hypothetical protein